MEEHLPLPRAQQTLADFVGHDLSMIDEGSEVSSLFSSQGLILEPCAVEDAQSWTHSLLETQNHNGGEGLDDSEEDSKMDCAMDCENACQPPSDTGMMSRAGSPAVSMASSIATLRQHHRALGPPPEDLADSPELEAASHNTRPNSIVSSTSSWIQVLDRSSPLSESPWASNNRTLGLHRLRQFATKSRDRLGAAFESSLHLPTGEVAQEVAGGDIATPHGLFDPIADGREGKQSKGRTWFKRHRSRPALISAARVSHPSMSVDHNGSSEDQNTTYTLQQYPTAEGTVYVETRVWFVPHSAGQR